jgi:hypothetical protein
MLRFKIEPSVGCEGTAEEHVLYTVLYNTLSRRVSKLAADSENGDCSWWTYAPFKSIC